jgi:mono/diheme cytochrome c family protein
MTLPRAFLALLLAIAGGTAGVTQDAKPADVPAKISYFKDVRPVFAQHCNGCHQPAKAQGGYVMTGFADLFKAGEQGKPGVVAGKVAQSNLAEQVRVHNGKAQMPKGRDPLTPAQVKLITDWIAQGATDDTPASAKGVAIDMANPPTYAAPPTVTSLAFDPAGEFLAVSGFHEVLLYSAKDYTLASRLVGISERINAVSFSPNGERLAVAGGSPGRFGEIQVWNHKREDLVTSVPVTFDTVYGVSWSPNGKAIAFGCIDNTVRAIDPATGRQTLQMGTHTDWVLGTVFSQDGEHVASVSRDMSVRLTEVPTQRFIDNVTSITPGALKGGLMSVDRRPTKDKKMQVVPKDTPGVPPRVYDELVVAGADGAPRLYKMHREAIRQIGDDANKIREYEKLPGRVSGLAFNADGKFFAAASSLDGKGEVRVYETDTGKKVVCEGVTGPAYAVAWHPDGKTIASAGFDGTVWLHEAATGKLVRQFVARPTTPPAK